MNIQNMKITDIRPYEKNPRLNEGDADIYGFPDNWQEQRKFLFYLNICCMEIFCSNIC